MHYHAIPLMIARRLSLHALLMVAVSVLLLSHSAPALADVPSHYAYVLSRTGSVWKYALDNNEQPIPPGQSQAAGLDPYALTVDSSRGLLFMTTFTQQDLWMFRIDKATGNLRLLSTARTDLTPEAVATDGQWVFVACSAAHSVLVYEVNPTSEKLILRWRVLAGQTPTSVAVHSSLPAVYVSDYSRNFVYTFKLDRSTGELTPIGAQTTGDSPYAVAVTPSGAFAYVANRFSNSLTGYTIDASTGVLTKRDTTRTGVKPRAIAIDPTTHLLFTANEGDETVGRYTIDNDNYGRLTFQGSVESTERFPWALTVADSGRHLSVVYAGATGHRGSVATYEITGPDGHLQLSGPPVPAGVFADAIAIVDFSPPAPPPPHNSTEIPAPHHLLDVNGDGRADLVWYDATTSQAALWFLNGPTLLGGGLVGFPVDSAWQVVGVGDVNGDGKADLVWRHTTTGQVALWLLNGSELLGAGLVGAPLSLDWQLR